MKSLVLIVVLLLSYKVQCKSTLDTPELIKMLQPLHDACQQSSGASESSIAAFTTSKGKSVADAQLKSYMACVLDLTGTLDANGNIMLDKLVGMLPPGVGSIYGNMIKTCTKLQGKTAEDRALWYFQCGMKNDPANFRLF
ncbi:general odorant-binding protein 83a-like [Drosophila busckii]|uniref:general odorant-binding protein 83a-like n=1 Tax=Drosophila busckii TaxID=30019 RepID=UPI00083F4459|nr:general odorant-binding protein 83a-like [Drosophila busckii]